MIGAWARLLWNSAVVAAVAAAAQLGAADALGIIRWDATGASTRDWTALLTWVAFCFAVAVLGGALVGRRAVRRADRRDGLGGRITASLAAAIGAAAVIGLAWLPANNSQPPANVNPGLVVSITAGAGVLVGLVVSLLALSAAPIAVGVRATVAWVWLVAIGCAVAGLVSHEPYPSPRLGVVDAPSLISASAWTGPRVMIGVAALLGLVVAGIARWGGSGRFGISLAGFGGPALVAAAYLIAGPGTSTDRTAQAEPYLAALSAAAAGLIASVLIAMTGRRVPVSTRQELNIDDLWPLTGDVVSPPERPGSVGRPRRGERPEYSGAGAGPRAAERDRAAYTSSDRQSQPPGGRTGWDADTWPGFHTGGGGRHVDPDEAPADPHSGSAATYRGGTYASDAYESVTVTGAMPTMGQPVDPHESWLRDLGPSGRHSSDDGHP